MSQKTGLLHSRKAPHDASVIIFLNVHYLFQEQYNHGAGFCPRRPLLYNATAPREIMLHSIACRTCFLELFVQQLISFTFSLCPLWSTLGLCSITGQSAGSIPVATQWQAAWDLGLWFCFPQRRVQAISVTRSILESTATAAACPRVGTGLDGSSLLIGSLGSGLWNNVWKCQASAGFRDDQQPACWRQSQEGELRQGNQSQGGESCC